MNLHRAIEIALEAHKGAVDKAGNPYILHPLRVMLSLETEEEKIVGVLHDVIEDCPDWTFEALQAEGFSESVLSALQSVTKSDDDRDYFEFVQRAKNNPIGRNVKISDITDNLDTKRLSEVTTKDAERLTRYLKAIKFLKSEPETYMEIKSRDLLTVWQSADEKSVEPLTEIEQNLVKR